MFSPKAKEYITAVGFTAETAHLLYEDFLLQGFTKQQALDLTREYIKATFTPHGGTGNGENN